MDMTPIEVKRYQSHNPVLNSDNIGGSIPSSTTDHSHSNIDFLNNLNIDNSYRLTYSNNVIGIPMLQEDW